MRDRVGARWRQHRKTPQLLSLGGLVAVLTAGAALTQEGGGVLLTFGIEQRASWVDESRPRYSVDRGPCPFRHQALLRHRLGNPERPSGIQSWRCAAGEDRGGGFGFSLDTPSADLAYTRSGPSSSLTLSAFLREADLGEGLALIEGSEGEPPVLVFEDGSSRTKGVRLAYSWGEGAPLGGTLRAGLTDTDYRDTTDPDLLDNRTVTVGAGFGSR